MPATTAPAFWDKIAEKYARRPIGDTDAYEKTLEITRSYLAPTDAVLELGCGTASTALKLAGDVARYTASDYAQGMVDIGRAKLADAGVENVSVIRAAPGEDALGAGPYDAILAYNFLHLMPDPHAVARDAHKRLKPGGYFISKSGCLAGTRFALLRPVLWVLRQFGKVPYVNFLTPQALEAQIADAGFEIVETGNYPASPPARLIVARKIA